MKKDQEIKTKSPQNDLSDIPFEDVVKRLLETPPKKQSEIKAKKVEKKKNNENR